MCVCVRVRILRPRSSLSLSLSLSLPLSRVDAGVHLPEARVIFQPARNRAAAPPRHSMDCRRIVIYEASTPEYFSHCPRSNDKSSRAAMALGGVGAGGCRAFVTKCASLAIYALFRRPPAAKSSGRRNYRSFRDQSLSSWKTRYLALLKLVHFGV